MPCWFIWRALCTVVSLQTRPPVWSCDWSVRVSSRLSRRSMWKTWVISITPSTWNYSSYYNLNCCVWNRLWCGTLRTWVRRTLRVRWGALRSDYRTVSLFSWKDWGPLWERYTHIFTVQTWAFDLSNLTFILSLSLRVWHHVLRSRLFFAMSVCTRRRVWPAHRSLYLSSYLDGTHLWGRWACIQFNFNFIALFTFFIVAKQFCIIKDK